MSAQTPLVVRDTAGIVGYYMVLEVVVTTGDTFKVQQLTAINGVVALKVADWSSVSCTHAGNVVTVTQAGLSATRIVALVGGQK